MKCSYCGFDKRGGVVFDPEHPRALGIWDDNADAFDLIITGNVGEKRVICNSCQIKVFDTILQSSSTKVNK